MRTLAASNPFPTASQSLAALFNEIRPKAENLMRQLRRPKAEATHSHHTSFHSTDPRFQRVEIWIHPVDGQTTVLQGARRLVYLPATTSCGAQKGGPRSQVSLSDWDRVGDNDEDDEEAQAEQEEYANMSLIEALLRELFSVPINDLRLFSIATGNMETFPEVASVALQALSGLLAQKPCPLSAERLCQLCLVNMYNVDRAMSLTTHVGSISSTKDKNLGTKTGGVLDQLDRPLHSGIEVELDRSKIQPISRLSGSETLRSVHHDHAARFALDAFSLLCRRTAQLLQEWMILHPEHWLPPPNHRDPTLRPYLNDWQLVAELCTRAANWLNRNSTRPEYEEVNPTTSLVLRLKGISEGENEDGEKQSRDQLQDFQAAFLFEEAYVAGFKPMLDLVPKLYRYTGDWASETVADFVRIEKLVLFGDFLCGIEPPVLTYDVNRSVYESAIERESSERKQDRPLEPKHLNNSLDSNESTPSSNEKNKPGVSSEMTDLNDSQASADIAALQLKRALLQRQLEEEARLAAWRRNAISQAASGGRRAIELEVRPIYLLPDTNCYIDWLEGIATLAQRSSNYTVLVPIVVVNELDTLARYGSSSSNGSTWRSGRLIEEDGEVTRAGLIQERAHQAITYLEHESTNADCQGAHIMETEDVGASVPDAASTLTERNDAQNEPTNIGQLNACTSAQAAWETENNVETILGPVDEYFKYDVKAHQSIVNAKPWEKDPHYFKYIKISAVALLKMLIHARSGGNIEIMGVLIGKVAHQTMIVVDSSPLPVEGTETRVNAQVSFSYSLP
ncbi:unnamed protein product [Echinostoma caproni]|uniref:COP9 signalosome complex subunit 5 n=1 Tax=Echinostoma caproni TaxID=27848 RepID=A0A183B2H3_9TREM|nr:unnamed protein product [Echinostoma caproni]